MNDPHRHDGAGPIRRRHIGAYGVILRDGAILLVRKMRGPYTGLLDLPGGGIEFGEEPAAALRREVREETGMALVGWEPLDAVAHRVEYLNGDGEREDLHHIGILYRADAGGTLRSDGDGEDSGGPLWVPVHLIDDAGVTPFARRALALLDTDSSGYYSRNNRSSLFRSSIMRYALRPATSADLDFLDDLHTICMRPHVEKIYPWDSGFFRRTFEPSRLRVISVDGEDIGMLSVSEENNVVLLRQISILPQYRNRGLGGEIVGAVIADAERREMPVELRVLRLSPARDLYERLGFRTVVETDTHHIMRRELRGDEPRSIVIRPMEQRESEEAKTVIRGAWREIFDEIAVTEPVSSFVHDYFDDPAVLRDMDDIAESYRDGIFLVTLDGEKIVGTGAVRRMDETHCELRRMFLRREYRGTGIGRRITSRLIDFASDAGYRRMRLGSNRKLYTAHAFYRHLGFYDIEPYEEGTAEYVLYMEKILD